jgi:K+ transporter
MMGTLKWIAVAVAAVVATFALVEAVLLKSSRYRLMHGDGRERGFRKP